MEDLELLKSLVVFLFEFSVLPMGDNWRGSRRCRNCHGRRGGMQTQLELDITNSANRILIRKTQRKLPKTDIIDSYKLKIEKSIEI